MAGGWFGGWPARDRWWRYARWVGLALVQFIALVVVFLIGTRLLGVDNRYPIAIVMAALPTALFVAYPLAVAGLWRRRVVLATVGLVGVAVHLWWFGGMLPVVHQRRALPHGAARVGVLTANLLYLNHDTASVGPQIARLNPDVIAFEEFSTASSPAIRAAPELDAYPNRMLHPSGNSDGLALYSKFPLDNERVVSLAGRQVFVVDVVTPNGPVTFVVVHTVAPIDSTSTGIWSRELGEVASLVRGLHGPIVVLGDFNATLGNKALTDVVDAGHLTDTLNATGDGYAMTWPANRRVLPPVVRPDHVFVGRGVVALDGHTVSVHGSDHRAIITDVGVPAPQR